MNEKIEKIGCPLEVILRIFSEGIYVKNDYTKNKMKYLKPHQIRVIHCGEKWFITFGKRKKYSYASHKYVGVFEYGKKWSLTKKELLDKKSSNVYYLKKKRLRILEEIKPHLKFSNDYDYLIDIDKGEETLRIGNYFIDCTGDNVLTIKKKIVYGYPGSFHTLNPNDKEEPK